MEAAAVTTRAPLPASAAGRPLLVALARPRRGFASTSTTSSFGGGGGGARFSAGGGGGGGGDDSGAGAAAAAAAVAALGEAEQADGDPDAIVLHVGGMSCGGCASKVKRILEAQKRRKYSIFRLAAFVEQSTESISKAFLSSAVKKLYAVNNATTESAVAYAAACIDLWSMRCYASSVLLDQFGETPEVSAATVDVEKATALVWTTPEAKATDDWQKQLGEKLANHLTSCGFQSHLQDEREAEQTDS